MSEKKEKERYDGPLDVEMDLDDTSDEGGQSFDFQDGDEFIVVLEDADFRKGPNGVYAAHTSRIVAGPLNREGNAGPRRSEEDGSILSYRLWDNLSFSPKARWKMKPFLRAIGHAGSIKIVSQEMDSTGRKPVEQWQDMTCDREMKVVIEMEEPKQREGSKKAAKARPKISGYEPLSQADWRVVARVYESDVGPARGCAWSPDGAVAPINKWDGIPGVDGTRTVVPDAPTAAEEDACPFAND